MRRRSVPAHAAPGRRRQTRVPALVAAVTAALTVVAGALLLGPTAAFGDVSIDSDGPLTDITISPTLNCAVNHTGDTHGEWYNGTACGTFVAVGDALYGPSSVPAGGGATTAAGYTAFTPVSQTANDDGTVVTTVVALGTSALTLTETDTYVVGQETYRTAVRIDNAGRVAVPVTVYRGGDCYLQDSDTGLGAVQNGNAPVCQAQAGSTSPDRIEAMYPLTAGSHYLESQYNDVWTHIGSRTDLPDTINAGTDPIDNGLALSWAKTVPGGGSSTVSALTVFSPLGAAPLSFGKTADADTATAGSPDGYTVTVTNPGAAAQTLTSITDTLPAGFAYVAGTSTEGFGDPDADGQTLAWSGNFSVPGADEDGAPGSLGLHFDVTVSGVAGTYTNSVTGAGSGVSVIAATAVAPITVTSDDTNHAPVGVDDSYSVDENETLDVPAGTGVLANDTDADGDTLVAVPHTAPAHGTLTLAPDGSFVYTPATGYFGEDSFDYQASDSVATSGFTTVSLEVDTVPIVATNDAYTTTPGTTLSVAADAGVLANDTPHDGRESAQVVTPPGHGTLDLATDGSFDYTPTTGFLGDDTFTYTAAAETTPATVTITVARTNRAPVASPDSYSVTQGSTLTVPAEGVLTNDSDPDGDTLSAIDAGKAGHGVVDLQGDGSFTYVPDLGFRGTDTFTYVASDGSAESGTATVTITVRPRNHAPLAVPDSYSTPIGTALTVAAPGVLADDTDPDGDVLTALLVSPPAHGSLTLSAKGRVRYTPAAGFAGVDTFRYRAFDGSVSSGAVTVTIAVLAPDRPPVAEPDSYSTPQGTRLTVDAPGVLANDTDPDGELLHAVLVTGTAHGALALQTDGRIDYLPGAGFVGTDRFRYRDTAAGSLSPSVRVTIVVTAPAVPGTTKQGGTPDSVAPVPPGDTVGTPTPASTPPILDTPTTGPPAPPASNPPATGGRSGRPHTLRLDAVSVNPGGALRATGSGCTAGAPVSLTVRGRPAGAGTADGSGAFDVGVTTSGLPVGSYTVTATCGGRILAAPVSLVYVTSNTTAPTAQALVVAAALAFFLLLLGLVVRRPNR